MVIVDNRTTDICRAFVGKRVSKAKMTKFPPFHYGCRTTLAAVFRDQAPDTDDELGEDAQPADGFGADPREVIRRADPTNRTESEPAVLQKPDRLPDETPPPVQKHLGGPRNTRGRERAADVAREDWLRAGGTTTGQAYDAYERAWTRLAQARQAQIRESERGLTPEEIERGRQRIRRSLDRLRNEPNEWAQIFDRRGRLLWRGTSGQLDRIRLPGDDLPGGQPAEHWRGAILVHNHPAGVSRVEYPGFGEGDLNVLMLTRAAESWAGYYLADEWRRVGVSPPSDGWNLPRAELVGRLREAHAVALQREAILYPEAPRQRLDVWAEALAELRNHGLLQFVQEAGKA